MQLGGYVLVDLTHESSSKTPSWFTQDYLKWIGNKSIRGQIFVLNEWEVRSRVYDNSLALESRRMYYYQSHCYLYTKVVYYLFLTCYLKQYAT